MAKLTNVQLCEYSNARLRVVADTLARLDMQLSGLRAEYDAKNLGTVIEAGGAGELIEDGSARDGRTPVTGGDVYNLVTLIDDLKTFFDASGRRAVVAKWQVNGLRVN